VRDALEARDILHANMCLVRDFAGEPLPPRPLAACLAQLRAAPTHLGTADGAGLASGLFLPDEALTRTRTRTRTRTLSLTLNLTLTLTLILTLTLT